MYNKEEIDGKTKYICLDEKGKYYIFTKENTVNYNVILDTYTIDTEEFLAKYNAGNEKTKAGMNVERFFEALNRKDFTYIYNHLDESFKNNYYNNVEALKEYLLKQGIYERTAKIQLL